MKFRKYLAALTKTTEVGRYVIGNSSADYDSFFGSIILAYFLTATTGSVHLPLIDCLQKELPLRFEIMQVLHRLKIDHSIFTYRQSFPSLPQSSIFTLYDHNFRKDCQNIEYIVDHHDLHANSKGRKVLVDKMGSGLTILYYLLNPTYFESVAEQPEEAHPFVAKYRQFVDGQRLLSVQLEKEYDRQVDEIIGSGILLDTFNLDPKQKDRWTIFDERALHHLHEKQIYGLSFEELSDLKFNVDLNKGLSFEQSLAKDFKRFSYGGLVIDYSIIYLHPDVFYEHYRQGLERLMADRGAEWSVYMLMHIFKAEGGQLQRQVMFSTKEEQQLQLIQQFLAAQGLQRGTAIGGWRRWRDASATVSRKKFDAEFRKYYKDVLSQI